MAVVLFRISQFLWRKRIIWRIAPFIKRLNEILTGFECHLEATIETGLFLAHTQNIVVGEGTRVGKNVTLYNGVTLGASKVASSSKKDRYPQISNDVIIYSGAKILGNIAIGQGAVVGANAVVLKNIPDGCVAVGVPAKVMTHKGTG